jgi:hypothetical protein
MDTSTPMRYLLARLRAAYADPAAFSDDQILRFLNDGYKAACVASHCLRAWTTITLTANFQEYALPSDWVATIGVYMAGNRMTPLSTRIAPRGDRGPFYYSFDGVLGLVTVPIAGGSLVLHYAREPVSLGIDDTPEQQFGPEWYWIMRSYAVWHLASLSSGAQDISRARHERDLFDQGVAQLERFSTSQNIPGQAQRMTHVNMLVGQPIPQMWVPNAG